MTDKNPFLSFYMLKLGLLAPVMNDAFFFSVFIFDILVKIQVVEVVYTAIWVLYSFP